MRIGLNASVTSQIDMDTIASGGFSSVRFPIWLGQQPLAKTRFQRANQLGINPILVLDRNAYTAWGWEQKKPEGSHRIWRGSFPNPPVIQVGNEPDQEGPSSSTMSKDDWFKFIASAHETWPRTTIIAGGLTHIDYTYLDGIDDTGASFVSVHPYGAQPEDVPTIIANIRSHTKLPIVITELGSEHGYEGDESARAQWHTNMLLALWEAGVGMVDIYCGQDDQGPFGLLDAGGHPYESWAAVVNAIPNLVGPPPTPAPTTVVQVPSPNHFQGRSGHTALAIVLHTMSGTLAGCDSWFTQSASQVSAHYGVGLDGSIHQYVQEQDGAWANGILEAGNTWPYGNTNPNYSTLSIETEDNGNPSQAVTPEQYASVLYLIKDMQSRWPNLADLMTHSVISPRTRPNCPGARWVGSGKMKALADATGLTLLI